MASPPVAPPRSVGVAGRGLPAIDGYVLQEVIGSGGFSAVHRAYQPKFDRYVAVKVMETGLDPARAAAEVRALGALSSHPQVAEVYDAGTTADGRFFVSMPLYSGGTLGDRISREGALPLDTVLRLGVKLCSALAHVHAAGVVHRDVKPHNVLLTAYGDVVLSDFGLAQGLATDPLVAFTPAYAAPEALEGARVGPAADVYGLGCVLYECATGRPLYPSATLPELLEAKLSGSPPLEGLPGDLARLLGETLSRDPGARPSASDLGAGLQALQRARGDPVTELHALRPDEPDVPTPPAPQPSGPITVVPDPPVAPAPAPYAPLPQQPGPAWDAAPAPAPPWPAPPQPSYPLNQTWPPAAASVPPPPLPPAPGPASAPPSDGAWYAGRAPRRSLLRLAAAPVLALAALLGALLGAAVSAGTWLARRLRRPPAPSAAPAEPPFAALTADRPSVTDRLGYLPLVEGLARLLDDPATSLPLTVAVGGQWGAGKTSLMLQVEAELRRAAATTGRPAYCVWFDAWRFQGREAFWAGLARAIYRQGQDELGGPLRRLRFRVRLERRRRGALRFYGALAVGAAGLAFVVAALARPGAGGWSLAAAVGAALTATTTVLSYVGALSQPFDRAISKGSVARKYDEFLGISDQAERDIEHLVATLTSMEPGAMVVVFLDDLDRCQPAMIGQALATVSEVFGRREGDRIAFVLGVDVEIVLGAVDEVYSAVRTVMGRTNPRRSGALSENFLEKVFQLHVNIDAARWRVADRLFEVLDAGPPGPADVASAAALREAVQGLQVSKPQDLTSARHRAGIDSQVLDDVQLAVLHDAVRMRRAALLTRTNDDVLHAERLVLRSLDLTPRAVKRFDNAFRLQLQVANSTPGSQLGFGRDELVATAKWVALRMFFPTLARAVDRRPGLWADLEQAALADGAPRAVAALLRDVAPDTDAGAVADVCALLAIECPASSLSTLPLDTFATVT